LQHKKVILIGGSAGSLPVLFRLLRELPASFSAAIVIVLHRLAGHRSSLESLLQKECSLSVKEVSQFDQLQAGVVHLTPADYHLLVDANGRLELDFSEKVQYSRPSIDVSLFSFARAYGPQLIAVMLSGANSDGADGSYEVKQRGGKLIVQSPDEAEVSTMPKAVIEANIDVDAVAMSTELKETLFKYLNHEAN